MRDNANHTNEALSRQRAPPAITAILLVVLTALWLALAIDPVSRQGWLLENLLVLLTAPLLVATRRRLRLSNSTYVCLFIFFALHSVGAH